MNLFELLFFFFEWSTTAVSNGIVLILNSSEQFLAKNVYPVVCIFVCEVQK